MSVSSMVISLIMLLMVGSASYYVAIRVYQCVNFIFPKINVKLYIAIFILITLIMIVGFMRAFLPFSVSVRNILKFISSYWIGIFIYLFLFFAVSDLILLFGKLVGIIPKPIIRNIRFVSGLIVIILTIMTVSYGIYNGNQIKKVSYDINLEEYNLSSELNIVLISDLHIGAVNSENRLNRIVNNVNDLKPDIVCIAGDIFDNDYYAIHNPDKAIEVLKNIDSKYGVYASLGNHDAGDTLDEMFDFLEKSNIKVLNDEYMVIDGSIVLIGRLDSSPIDGFNGMRRKNIGEVMENINIDLPITVMDHNPINIDEYDNSVDLILSGHTHKGQIFPGSIFTNMLYTVDYGHYQKDNDSPHVIVSSGAGTWGMPMRVGTNCEVVNIKLH